MYNFFKGIIFIGVISAIFINCSEEIDAPKSGTVDVLFEFQKYLDRFIEEGESRGYTPDFTDTGLSIQFGNLPPEAAGVCSELGGQMSGSHNIEIRKEYWIILTDIQKERLIFHELGHCELNRPHDNQVFSNGDWKSIMRGDPLPEGKTAIVNYTGIRRDFYIDELFDPTTPRPSWLDITADYNAIALENKTLIYEEYDMQEFDARTSLNGIDNFEIELEIELIGGLDYGGISWSGPEINNSLHFYFHNGKQIYIHSGENLFGILHVFDYPSNIAFQPNKLTIRRLGDFYYLFYNEQFLYWLDYTKLRSAFLKSLVHPDVDIQYHTLKVYTID